MKPCPFCNLESESTPAEPTAAATPPGDGPRRIGLAGIARRTWRGIQWLAPAVAMLLIPKCPLCVAAYVAMFTGVGITVPTAEWIQRLMLVTCLASLAFLAFRFIRTFLRKNHVHRTSHAW